MKLGEVVVTHVYYCFTKLHPNRMKNKKVFLIASFCVQNFKVSVQSWKSYIAHLLTWSICITCWLLLWSSSATIQVKNPSDWISWCNFATTSVKFSFFSPCCDQENSWLSACLAWFGHNHPPTFSLSFFFPVYDNDWEHFVIQYISYDTLTGAKGVA